MQANLRPCRVTRENSSDLAEYAREFVDARESAFALIRNDPEAFLARVQMLEAREDLPSKWGSYELVLASPRRSHRCQQPTHSR